MTNVYYRVDDRLIHGQVITGWSRYYHLKKIIIVDDVVANDAIQKQIISLVAPPNIKVHITNVLEGSHLIKEANQNQESTLVLVKGPETLVDLARRNVTASKVVIGGMQFKHGRKKVTNTVSLTVDEAKAFQELSNANVELVLQVIPTDKAQDFKGHLNKLILREGV
ncbi:PTS system mannose/fructose/N-acetylgalactosamine-transporter subunit IIB [Lederbergia citri]|uniref:PTS sugar transporter subunit IIB n=1 Tax=Lederbergia citri TaxID=2833580 RepID=A0A942TFF9_9BACI|nr:PTS sugar transporter subunit IIB [Lederbergia citri]MBS4195781.1 PTS sugar transporter subunit IIB [Lederbergia citri]